METRDLISNQQKINKNKPYIKLLSILDCNIKIQYKIILLYRVVNKIDVLDWFKDKQSRKRKIT
jgi:hypothetical protein